MVEKVNELSHDCNKLSVCVELYDEIQKKEIKSHDEYIINLTKLKFLKDEILDMCDKISRITKRREHNTKI